MKEELIETPLSILRRRLQDLQDYEDSRWAHQVADELLLDYINDKEVTEAFNKITKHYA